jgi:hypothetical protein
VKRVDVGAEGAGGVARPAARPRHLSAGQIRAIYGAMRTFRDDDRGRHEREATVTCSRCGRGRPAAGALAYGALQLCNGCATDYELLRMAGIERDLTGTPEND